MNRAGEHPPEQRNDCVVRTSIQDAMNEQLRAGSSTCAVQRIKNFVLPRFEAPSQPDTAAGEQDVSTKRSRVTVRVAPGGALAICCFARIQAWFHRAKRCSTAIRERTDSESTKRGDIPNEVLCRKRYHDDILHWVFASRLTGH
jgi:hypothetical protein